MNKKLRPKRKPKTVKTIKVIPPSGGDPVWVEMTRAQLLELMEDGLVTADDRALTQMVWTNPSRTIVSVGGRSQLRAYLESVQAEEE